MSETTLFLLILDGILVPANVGLWLVEKMGQKTRQTPETIFYEERQNYVNKGKKLLSESNSNGGKVMAVQKSGRVKILEQYLKQV